MRKIISSLLLGAVLMTASYVLAADVFVTQKGAKYHKETCQLIKNKGSLNKVDKAQAIEDGLEPCKKCFKEDMLPELGEKNK